MIKESGIEKVKEKKSVLSQYRVLDLTDESGVFSTKIMAALGADVIRIEPPGGDPTRRIGPFYHDEADPEKSLHWFTFNLDKRSITLNIECATGQELFKRLVKTADFLVECFRPGYLDKLGLGYAELSAINPRLIHTSITPFGSTGPYSKFKGSNLVSLAASGFIYVCGDEDRAPVQITTPAVYLETGLHAASAMMVAHWYRRRSGEGQHVDVSAQEAMLAQVLPTFLLWRSHGIIGVRAPGGVTIPGRARHTSIFQCKDGRVLSGTTISGGRQQLRQWLKDEGLAGTLFDESWDPVFLEGRAVTKEQRNYIDDLFQALASRYSKDDFTREAQRRKIQVGKIQTVRDVANDPQLKERDYFVEVEHPELCDTISYQGCPFKAADVSFQYTRRAPFIGEHNNDIYVGELGLTQQELTVLKQGGAV